jgi:hypothetical protein
MALDILFRIEQDLDSYQMGHGSSSSSSNLSKVSIREGTGNIGALEIMK